MSDSLLSEIWSSQPSVFSCVNSKVRILATKAWGLTTSVASTFQNGSSHLSLVFQNILLLSSWPSPPFSRFPCFPLLLHYLLWFPELLGILFRYWEWCCAASSCSEELISPFRLTDLDITPVGLQYLFSLLLPSAKYIFICQARQVAGGKRSASWGSIGKSLILHPFLPLVISDTQNISLFPLSAGLWVCISWMDTGLLWFLWHSILTALLVNTAIRLQII